MTWTFQTLLILGSFLLFLGILLSRSSQRYGIPGLLLYLSLGIFIGNGGKYDFIFDYPDATLSYSSLALSLIIFIGGLGTHFTAIRPVLRDGMLLSTLGVALSTGVLATFVHFVIGLSWLEGLIIGSVLSATDAAAVFSIFDSQQIRLKDGIAQTLELESGTNDPMAFLLVSSFTLLLIHPATPVGTLVLNFAVELVVGGAMGLLFGWFTIWLLRRLMLGNAGSYSLLVLSIALFEIGVVPLLHGSVFLAVYVSGIYISNKTIDGKGLNKVFFESISWLTEISLFGILGLQVFPHEMLPHGLNALLIALFLIFVARPVSIYAIFSWLPTTHNKRLFLSWVGLRGATPIVFSLIPVTAQVKQADLIFNTVFIVVIISVLIQGTTVGWLARRLGLTEQRQKEMVN